MDIDHLEWAGAGISEGMRNSGGHHHDLAFAGFDRLAANFERHPAAADQEHFRIKMPVHFRPPPDSSMSLAMMLMLEPLAAPCHSPEKRLVEPSQLSGWITIAPEAK